MEITATMITRCRADGHQMRKSLAEIERDWHADREEWAKQIQAVLPQVFAGTDTKKG